MFDLISKLASGVFSLFQGNQEIHAAKVKAKVALQEQKAANASKLALTQVKQSGKILKWFCALQISLPIDAAFFMPDYMGQHAAVALQQFPHWWVIVWVGINLSVFGILQSIHSISGLLSA